MDVHPFPAPLTLPIPRRPLEDWPPLPPSVHDWEWPPGWEERLGEPYQLGTLPAPPIAVAVGQRRYVDLDGNDAVVSINNHFEVLPPLSVFQFAAVFSERLDARRFVLGMPLSGHELTIDIEPRTLQTACSGWLPRWIHLGGSGAAWLRTFGEDTKMPLLRMSEAICYERRLTRMLWSIRDTILGGDLSQNSVLSSTDHCFF